MLKPISYSIVNNKTGEYYAQGCATRQECVQQMEANKWRNATIVTRYRLESPPKTVNQSEQKVRLYELQRVDGAKTYYREAKDIADLLGTTEDSVLVAVKRKGFGYRGVLKDYLINRIVVTEIKAEELLKKVFKPMKEYKEVYVVEHRKGSTCVFDTREEACQFFKVTKYHLGRIVDSDTYATTGVAKDWRVYTRLMEV